MKKNERLLALHIVTTLLDKKIPLSHLMATEKELTPFTKELCFGVCRHYLRLTTLADSLVQKRPKQTDIWILLLMGLYQQQYLDLPDYAIVKETVAVLDNIKKSWAKGLVNAVLRTFSREREARMSALQDNPTFQYGHPEWLLQRLTSAWPNNWHAIVTANDARAPMSLRVNQQRTSTATYLLRLQDNGIDAHAHPHAPHGIVLSKPCDVHDLPGFAEGDVSVQDIAAQHATSLLQLRPQLRVLDACAAPGGKICHLLEHEPTLISTALDIDPKRLPRIKDNLSRLHLHASIREGDASKPETWWDGIPFERILLDAPCSATGVIRRHPDIKWLRTPNDIDNITQLQQQLLQSLWPLLSTNGLLVYATCSVLPEENEQQIATFVAHQPDARVVEIPASWGYATGHGRQILPGEDDMDGFFYSVLQKV